MENLLQMLLDAKKGLSEKIKVIGIDDTCTDSFRIHSNFESLETIPGELEISDFDLAYFKASKNLNGIEIFCLISHEKARELKGLVPCPTCGKECLAHA